MEHEIPGGFIQVETDPDKMEPAKASGGEHPLARQSSDHVTDSSTTNHFEQNLPGATIPAPPSPYHKCVKAS